MPSRLAAMPAGGSSNAGLSSGPSVMPGRGESAVPVARRPEPCWSSHRRCLRAAGLNACGLELLLGEVADFAGERDLVRAHFSGVANAQFVALEVQHFHKAQGVAGDLAFLQFRLALPFTGLRGGFAAQLVAVGLEREQVFLHPDLGVELRPPLTSDVRRVVADARSPTVPPRRISLVMFISAFLERFAGGFESIVSTLDGPFHGLVL